jgi:ABC-type antimicrobial peptide transport system permease subunit
MTLEVVFIFFAWVARIACIFGLVFGFFLLFAPAKMQAIEGKMNNWFETRTIFEKLDRSGPELDVLFFRYPFFFGMAGAVISFLIITLATVNLLS